MGCDVDHREPTIADQLNIDILEIADPCPAELAPMDGFGFYYIIMG